MRSLCDLGDGDRLLQLIVPHVGCIERGVMAGVIS